VKKDLTTTDVLVAPKMNFMRLRNESKTNDDLVRDFHRDNLPIQGDLMCLISLIADRYVAMLSPALGPAVLPWPWGAYVYVATDHISSLEI
jgi:hypothetical protein